MIIVSMTIVLIFMSALCAALSSEEKAALRLVNAAGGCSACLSEQVRHFCTLVLARFTKLVLCVYLINQCGGELNRDGLLCDVDEHASVLYWHRALGRPDARAHGTLSPALGRVSHLARVDLTDAQLRGSLPSELGLLTHLHFLALNDNPQLSGRLVGDSLLFSSILLSLVSISINMQAPPSPSTKSLPNWR